MSASSPSLGQLLLRYPRALLFALALSLFLGSWHQWVDLLVDSGYNLYLFFELARGKVLFRDLYYYHGPLAPLLYGKTFALFGPSIRLVAGINFLFVIVISQLLFSLGKARGGVGAGLLLGAFFLSVFAFGQYDIVGNYNFIFPYKPEINLGSMLLFLAIYGAHRWRGGATLPQAFGLGLLLGLSLLLSIEIAFAGLAMAITIQSLKFFKRGRAAIPAASTFLLGLFVPAVGAFFFFLRNFDASESWQFTWNAFAILWTKPMVTQSSFFIWGMGLDRPWARLASILGATSTAALLALGLQKSEGRLTHKNQMRLLALLLVAGGLVQTIFSQASFTFLHQVALVVPLTAVFFFARLLWDCWQGKAWSYGPILWGLASCFFLLKVFLNPRWGHYGFFLLMPATLFVIAEIWNQWQRDYRGLRWSTLMLTAFLSLVAVAHLQKSQETFAQKTLILGQGADSLAAFSSELTDQGKTMEMALRWIELRVPKNATLLTLPEANMLNYLSRRSSVGRATFNPLEFMVHGEDFILEDFRNSPPDFVALVTRDGSQWGFPPFGASDSYGRKTLDWVNANFDLVERLGWEPFLSGGFGVYFYESKARRSAGTHKD